MQSCLTIAINFFQAASQAQLMYQDFLNSLPPTMRKKKPSPGVIIIDIFLSAAFMNFHLLVKRSQALWTKDRWSYWAEIWELGWLNKKLQTTKNLSFIRSISILLLCQMSRFVVTEKKVKISFCKFLFFLFRAPKSNAFCGQTPAAYFKLNRNCWFSQKKTQDFGSL